MVNSVAVIGVGAMGGPIARRLLDSGYNVVVCDARPEAVEPFEGTDAHITRHPRGCRDADLALCLVASADQVRDVVVGEGGLAHPGSAGTSPTIAVMSTVGHDFLRRLQDELSSKSAARLLDAPISGGPARAEQGRLSVILGGADDDVEACRSVFSCLGHDVFHCGPVGAAQVIKVANNVIGSVNTLISGEVYRLLQDLGVSLPAAIDIFEASSGRNWLSADPTAPSEVFSAYAPTKEAFEAMTRVMQKDSALGMQLAAESGASFPTMEAVAQVIGVLGSETFENWRLAGGL
ncbi:MAG: NAD(P)-dependent oxidoreductase [Hyphomicrobiales bacterium]|nr:MAG: NAD(P)-dependent oxidoreductase [Hyphomicrobiales bacterium]